MSRHYHNVLEVLRFKVKSNITYLLPYKFKLVRRPKLVLLTLPSLALIPNVEFLYSNLYHHLRNSECVNLALNIK